MTRWLLTALLLASACGPKMSSRLMDHWRDPMALEGPFQKILVVGVTENHDNREAFEETFASELRATTAHAKASIHILGDRELTKENIEAAVAEHGYDAVLAAKVIEIDTAQVQQETTEYSAYTTTAAGDPYGRGNMFYSPYMMGPWMVDTVTFGGRWLQHQRVEVRFVLFRVADEAEVWHARTETIDPKKMRQASRQVGKVVVKDLKLVGMVPRGPEQY